MVKLYDGGAYLVDGYQIVADGPQATAEITGMVGENRAISKEEAKTNTIAYNILKEHNTSDSMEKLKIKFDKLTSHDITFVGIIQTARASGLEKFPIPYVLTNCHNSLCAVGGTINEDDHMFGLSCAKKYGGIYVPPHQAVIHQYAREQLAESGKMILGSDSHTRYGALGTMAIGEGGGELVKQLLEQTYDVDLPDVVGVYLEGMPQKGVGPQDVALAIIGAVFDNGYVKNKVMEFVGPGIANLSAEYRIGIDVMTTETTCLSSIWRTDEEIRHYYSVHDRIECYDHLEPGDVTYYDGMIHVDLSTIKPMIAMPFHPSNVYTIEEVKANLSDVLHDVEKRAQVSLDGKVDFTLQDKVRDGKLYVDQGVIAGCAGGGFENICEAADILRDHYIGNDAFTLSVYPASTPIYMEIAKNGVLADLMATGAIVKTAFCGPCFGAGDTPANNAFSIRHSTRNFPNREGSKIQNGQISSVALMDARSIAATAANQGFLTAADEELPIFTHQSYYFDKTIYANRVYNGWGNPQPDTELVFGPNIKDWPSMSPLPENLILKVVSEIHDPVTTTDELIPSGETSSYRSNPLGLAEFTLSRKDPAYVGRAKEVQAAEKARVAGEDPFAVLPELRQINDIIQSSCDDVDFTNTGIGSTIYAVKPGDGSAREQAASCQKVLGGWANVAQEYATKRYRSNLINWGMLPFLFPDEKLPFANGDYLFVPGIAKAVEEKQDKIDVYVVNKGMEQFTVTLGNLTDNEREIILKGCLINYNRK
jgi:aconitate hydratase